MCQWTNDINAFFTLYPKERMVEDDVDIVCHRDDTSSFYITERKDISKIKFGRNIWEYNKNVITYFNEK